MPLNSDIPWLEVNSPVEDRYAIAASGLDIWDKQGVDRAIISTTVSRAIQILSEIISRKPAGITIDGGLKTVAQLGAGFDDVAGWVTIAAKAAEVAALTGTNIVLLENESALDSFRRGNYVIDHDQLATALAPLAAQTAIEWWWWFPHVRLGDSVFPTRETETVALTRTVVGAVPNSKFLVDYWPRYDEPMVDGERLYGSTRGIVGAGNCIDKRNVQTDYWTAAQFTEERAGFTDDVVVYPGLADWIPTAHALLTLERRPRVWSRGARGW